MRKRMKENSEKSIDSLDGMSYSEITILYKRGDAL